MAKVIGLVVLIAAHWAAPAVSAGDRSGTVVFICERGSAKSIIATLWFDRLASERGLQLQGVSRGVNPDAKVPEALAHNLRNDGFDLTGVVPARLQSSDLAQAVHVVTIGAESPLFDTLAKAPERWDDIPPVSVDYSASRGAMRLRLGTLVEALLRKQPAGPRP